MAPEPEAAPKAPGSPTWPPDWGMVGWSCGRCHRWIPGGALAALILGPVGAKQLFDLAVENAKQLFEVCVEFANELFDGGREKCVEFLFTPKLYVCTRFLERRFFHAFFTAHVRFFHAFFTAG